MERAVRISNGSLQFAVPSTWVREDARKHWGLSLTYEHIERPPPPPHTHLCTLWTDASPPCV